MGNKTFRYSQDDYIIAAVNIYVDIIMLFLKILELMGKAKN
jgi:FtsH-binding integral membrane protein